MDVIEINNHVKWEQEIKNIASNCSFIQSWMWGDILISENKKVVRLAIVKNNNIIGLAQVVFLFLPFKIKYAFCPKGPIFKYKKNQPKIIEAIVRYLQTQNCIFFRIEPSFIDGIKAIKSTDINPRSTIILDITVPEDEILKTMKSKTRYNIRLSQKKQLKVVTKKDLNSFYNLSQKTAGRGEFNLHPKKHYQNVLKSSFSHQLSVQKNNKIIVSNIFIGYQNTFTYIFGALDHKYRNLMAPYLLQWQGILLAKKLGYTNYDFFGIAPESSKHKQNDKYNYNLNHQYAGVTRFKLGFSGQIVQDSGTFDIVIDKNKYYLYKLLRKFRRLF